MREEQTILDLLATNEEEGEAQAKQTANVGICDLCKGCANQLTGRPNVRMPTLRFHSLPYLTQQSIIVQ